jgi:hypothetical protein
VSLDRGDQCGSNGAKIVGFGWVLMELCTFESRVEKKKEKTGEKKER